MLIYRIEHHTTRKGPWRTDQTNATEIRGLQGNCPAFRYDHFARRDGLKPSSEHPNAYNDKLLCEYADDAFSHLHLKEYVFGFRDLDQLRAWFGSHDGREEMKLSGMIVQVYSVSRFDVLVGEQQLMFKDRAENTKRLHTLDLVSLTRNSDETQMAQIMIGSEVVKSVELNTPTPVTASEVENALKQAPAELKDVRLSFADMFSQQLQVEACIRKESAMGRALKKLIDEGLAVQTAPDEVDLTLTRDLEELKDISFKRQLDDCKKVMNDLPDWYDPENAGMPYPPCRYQK